MLNEQTHMIEIETEAARILGKIRDRSSPVEVGSGSRDNMLPFSPKLDGLDIQQSTQALGMQTATVNAGWKVQTREPINCLFGL